MSGPEQQLQALAARLGLASDEALRFRFGQACVARVEHLLEDPQAKLCAEVLRAYVAGTAPRTDFDAAARLAAEVASSHHGSGSIDASGHAAVSATNAMARAMAGKALEAASHAAYAAVYAYGGYAINDPAAFEPEYSWQAQELARLAAAD